MTTVPLVFFWDTLIMQLSLWQKVLASRKKRTLSFVRRGQVLIFWLVTMQENPNFRIWFANIKLKLGAYKAFFSLFPPSDCHDAGKASYHTSLLFEDLHHRFGRNLFWKALWIFTFISHSRTVKWCDRDLQGDMIHSWKYSLCRSKAAKTTLFFASKPADSCLLWYAVRQCGFLGKQQYNVLTYFGMQIPGHNKHMSWQQPTSDSCESVVSFSRLLDFILHDSWRRALEIIALSAVTPGGDEAVVYLWSWSLRKSEFCCDCSAVCNREQEEIHSWKVVFPGNEYHSL